MSNKQATDDRVICGAEVAATIPGISVGFEVNDHRTVMRIPGVRDTDNNGVVLVPRPKSPPTLTARVTFVCKLHPQHRGAHEERFPEGKFTWSEVEV